MKKAIVFIDIVSSSELWAKNEEKMFNLLDKMFKMIKTISENCNGVIIKTIGDAFMLEFSTLKNAVHFSINLQELLKVKQDYPRVRIGVSYGDVKVKSFTVQNCSTNDYFGNTVNTASRMESKVSPVSGIAVAIDENKDKTLISNVSKTKNIKLISFDDKELKMHRSTRLIPFSIQIMSPKLLHGVKIPFIVMVIDM